MKTLHLVIAALIVSTLSGCNSGSTKSDTGQEKYSIGGRVTGLQGDFITLANNGSDTVDVSDNGNFSFNQKVKKGEEYTITVVRQPQSPEQQCSVNNGTGIVTDNIDSIEVNCSNTGDSDSDGDGLADTRESEGWTIQVDFQGFGPNADTDKLETVHVTSDPNLIDSDGDGIDDFQEYLDRTNPSNRDTDSDGLTDYEEKYQWFTNASSVDSDSDARGPEQDNFPNNRLFDGAELERFLSPSSSDSDGDGKSDYYELITNTTRSPHIAEMPQILIDFENDVDIRLAVSYSEIESEEYGEAFATESIHSTEWSDTYSTATTVAGKGAFFDDLEFSKLGAIAFVGKKLLNFGLQALPDDVADDLNINKEPTPDITTTHSATLTKSSTQSASEEYSKYQTKSSGTETESGSVSVDLRVHNTGVFAFTLTDLFVNLRFWDPKQNTYITMATLTPDIDSEDGITLSPGSEPARINVKADNVDVDVIKQFLANPSAIMLDPAQFNLENFEDIDFDFIVEQTYNDTALLTIDYGSGNGVGENNRNVHHYRLSTIVDRYATAEENPDDPDSPFAPGDLKGTSMMTALREIIGLNYTTTERSFYNDDGEYVTVNVLTSINGVSNAINSQGEPFPEDRVEGVIQSPSAYWAIYTERDSQADESVNFEDILLKSKDQVRLVFLQDEDGDGLYKREERMFGTLDSPEDIRRPVEAGPNDKSIMIDYVDYPVKVVNNKIVFEDMPDGIPDSIDSDEDGLTDHQEVRDGWQVDDGEVRTVFSNPVIVDSDHDGWSDLFEYHYSADPTMYHVDIDRDGLIEIHDLERLYAMRNNLRGTYLELKRCKSDDEDSSPDDQCDLEQSESDDKGYTIQSSLGCPDDECYGYELATDLDFDTNGDGLVNEEDEFYYEKVDNGFGWFAIGDNTNPFRAHFYGNGYTIYNLTIRMSFNHQGLFGVIRGSENCNFNFNPNEKINDSCLNISNFKIESAHVESRSPVGIVAGEVTNHVELSDIELQGVVWGGWGYRDGAVGGLAGRCTETVYLKDITLLIQASGGTNLGGLCGLANRVTAETITVGSGDTLADFDGDMNTGGVFGSVENSSNCTLCESHVDIDSHDNVGGIAGLANDTELNLSNSHGEITATSYTGGLVGNLVRSEILQSYTTSSVMGENRVGGLVGNSAQSSTINRSFASSSVVGYQYSGNYIGGLAGLTYDTEINDTFATGSVSGRNFVGGLVGDANDGTIVTRSFTTSRVTGNVETTGTFVGWSDLAFYDGNVYRSEAGYRGIGTLYDGSPPTRNQLAGYSLETMQCPTSSNDSNCTNTTYSDWSESTWDFGNSNQLPGLWINERVYRDANGDGQLED